MRSTIRSVYRSLCNTIDTPAIILLYHRVTKLASDPQQLAVDPGNFDDQIEFLKREYHLIDFEEFVDIILKGKKIPKKSVILTFDDGYSDNLYEALPILEKHNAQAIFYITTSKLDSRNEFWWDALERVFLLGHPIPHELTVTLNSIPQRFNTTAQSDRIQTYKLLHPLIKDHKPVERDFLIEDIIRWSGLSTEGRDTHRILTSQELQKLSLSKSSFIGAHTDTHLKLSRCSFSEQYNDINLSKLKLEKLLDYKIEHFSYPFGSKADYDANSVRICEDLEFKIVCSNYYNQVHRWNSKFELPRILVRNWSIKEFQLKMNSFFTE